jgi:putative SOS response-associated peptidase YedK
MSVILHLRDYGRWLDSRSAGPPVDILCSDEADQMKTWKVGSDVGNVRNNRPDLVEPIETNS